MSGVSGRTLVVAVLVMIAAGMSWLFWARGRTMSRQAPAVALLPFQSDSAETEYLANGLTIELINSLSRVQTLRVASWSAVARWRGQAGNLKSLREGLQAGSVVDGTFRRQGGRIKIAVKLVDANNGETIWSDSLDRPEREIFQMQERISKGVVYALNVPMRMDPQRILVPVRTESMAVYDDYLRARAALGTGSAEGLGLSMGLAEKAAAGDPKFSPALGLLAAEYGLLQPLERASLLKAKALAERAIALDSASSEAHSALGMAQGIGEWDWPAARVSFERAVQWAPNSALAHAAVALGYLMPTNDLESAEYEARKAVALDGGSFYANYVAAEVMQARGKTADFQGFLQTATALCSACPRARQNAGTVKVGADLDAAFASVDRAIEEHDPAIAFLQCDPAFAGLRRDPRYQNALTRLKLRQ